MKLPSLIILTLMTLLTLSACDWISDQTDTEQIVKAEDYIKEGKINAGVIALKNALSLNPSNAYARLLLGELHLKIGNIDAALKELRKAEDLGASKQITTILIANAFLQLGRYDEVLQLPIGSDFSDSARSSLLASKAEASMIAGDLDSAESYIQDAFRVTPNHPGTIIIQAKLFAEKNDIDAAGKTIDKALEIDGSNAAAWRYKGIILTKTKDYDDAIAAYDKAIELSLNKRPDQFRKAKILAHLGRFSDAKELLEPLHRHAPGHKEVNYLLGLIAYKAGNWNKAEELLTQAETQLPGPSTYLLALTHLRQDHFVLAQEYLSRFRSKYPTHINALMLDAKLAMRDGDNSRAEQILRSITDLGYEGAMALEMLAAVQMAQGKHDDAQQVLTNLLKSSPDSPVAHHLLGRILIAKEQFDPGLQHLREAAKSRPDDLAIQSSLVDGLLKSGRNDEARVAASNYLHRMNNVGAYNLAGWVEYKLKSDQATLLFEKARRLDKTDRISRTLLASLSVDKQKYEEALNYLNEILTAHPGNPNALLRIAYIHAKKGDVETMSKIAEQAVESNPKLLMPRMVLARYYAYKKEWAKAKPILDNAPANATNETDYLWLKATVDAEVGDYYEANKMLDRLEHLTEAPGIHLAPRVHLLKARVLDEASNMGEIESELLKALKVQPDYLPAKLVLAKIRLKQKRLDEAQELITEMKNVPDSQQPLVLELSGRLHALKGELDKTVESYSKMYTLQKSPHSLLLLTDAQTKQGHTERAVTLLEQWLTEHPDDHAIRIMLARYQTKQGLSQKAVASYRVILAAEPNHVAALNNLALLLRETDPEEAQEFAKHAYQLQPESPSIMDTYALTLMDAGQLELALRMLDRAISGRPDIATLSYHRALVLQHQGNLGAAFQAVKQALAQEQTFAEKDNAIALLERLENSNN